MRSGDGAPEWSSGQGGPGAGAAHAENVAFAYPPTVAERAETARAIVDGIREGSAGPDLTDPDDMDSWDRERSIILAIAWALGSATEPPLETVTNGVVPTEQELRTEYRNAEYAIYHQRSTGIAYSYAAGVEHTLLWLLGDTDDPPWDLRRSP